MSDRTWVDGDALTPTNLNTLGGWSDPSDITALVNTVLPVSMSSLSGLLSTSSLTGVLAIANGGTALATAPGDGQLLVGTAGSVYTHRSVLSYSHLPSSTSTWVAGSDDTVGIKQHLSVHSRFRAGDSVAWGGGPYISSSSSVLGGSSSAGSAYLLARTVYHPASQVTTTIASSTTAAVDNTNITVTFTAPSSGSVYAVMKAGSEVSGIQSLNNIELCWGLFGNTASVLSSEVLARRLDVNDGGTIGDEYYTGGYVTVQTRDIAVSGTTTWVLAHRRRSGGGTVATIYGGRAGPAVLEIWAIT